MLWLRKCLPRNPYQRVLSKHLPSFSKNNFRAQSSVLILRSERSQIPAAKASEPGSTPQAEPWVNPYCLQETLNKHIRANRTGEAINGSLKRIKHRGKRIPKKKAASNDTNGGRKPGYRHFPIPTSHSNIALHGTKCKPLTTEWAISDRLPTVLSMPWVSHVDQAASTNGNINARQRLSAEIQACQQYLDPTNTEKDASRKAIVDVMETLTGVPGFENINFCVVGSHSTGLDGPLSDIDLNIEVVSTEDSRALLRRLQHQLMSRQRKYNKPSELLTHGLRPSRIPLVECTHKASGLDVEVLCHANDFSSIEIVKAYMAEFPSLPPLFKVLKQMLRMRGLTKGSHGGLTSYPLLHMLVASLKMHRIPSDDVASQLLQFLDQYAKIDFGKTAIRYITPKPTSQLRNQQLAALHNEQEHHDPYSLQPQLVQYSPSTSQYLMSLQDPANLDNDLGKSVDAMMHIQVVFNEARRQIRKAMLRWDKMYQYGLNMNTNGGPILRWCLEGNYSQFEEGRRQLRRYNSDLHH